MSSLNEKCARETRVGGMVTSTKLGKIFGGILEAGSVGSRSVHTGRTVIRILSSPYLLLASYIRPYSVQ